MVGRKEAEALIVHWYTDNLGSQMWEYPSLWLLDLWQLSHSVNMSPVVSFILGVLLYKQTEPKDSRMSRNRDQTQTQCYFWKFFSHNALFDVILSIYFFLCSFFTNLLLLHSGFWFWFYGFLCVKRVLWGVWMCFLFFLFDSFFSVCFILSLFVFILSYFIIWNPYMCYSDRIFFKKKGDMNFGKKRGSEQSYDRENHNEIIGSKKLLPMKEKIIPPFF